MAANAKSNATLVCLPTEIKHLIFCALPDLHTLKALVATHPTFRYAFENHSSFTVSQVLFHTIPPAIFPEALAVLASTRVPPQNTDRKRVEEVLNDYFLSLKQQSCQHGLTLVDAAAMEEFHRLVQLFTSRFMATALSICKNPNARNIDTESVNVNPSTNETYRFYRAFYRFELYCNLFGGTTRQRNPIFSGEEQRDLFFSHFAPWENEQLACAHDFLLSQIDEPFRDVAVHDVEWGELGVTYLNEGYPPSANGFQLHYISLGLRFVHQLTCTKPYNERSKILKSNFECRIKFLDKILLRSMVPFDRILLTEYDDTLLNRYIESPAIADPDPGPAEIWKFAYRHASRPQFVMEPEFGIFREWAYVMWDLQRLENWESVESRGGSRGLEAFRYPPNRSYHDEDEWAKEHRSMIRRSEIWRDGGDGWWSEDDESHVVYKYGKPDESLHA